MPDSAHKLLHPGRMSSENAVQDDYPVLLKRAREAKGMTQQQMGDAIRVSKQHYGRIENGKVRVDVDLARELSSLLGMKTHELFPQLDAPEIATVPLVGFVGAGEQVFGFDDRETGRIEAPPGAANAVVVTVRGSSMWPAYREGDLLFYQPTPSFDPAKCLGRDCVVQVIDGPTYVKRVLAGATPGVFTLASYRAPEINDVRIAWGAPIQWVKRP